MKILSQNLCLASKVPPESPLFPVRLTNNHIEIYGVLLSCASPHDKNVKCFSYLIILLGAT